MRTLIEEHGGAIATAAIVIIIIAAIVALGQTGHLQTVFTALIDTFTQKAQEAAKALFSTGAAADMPKTELTEEDLTDGNIDILTMLVKSGLTASKSEARRAVQQGGVAVDGEKVSDIATTFAKADFEGEGKVVRKGKKNFRKVIAK